MLKLIVQRTFDGTGVDVSWDQDFDGQLRQLRLTWAEASTLIYLIATLHQAETLIERVEDHNREQS